MVIELSLFGCRSDAERRVGEELGQLTFAINRVRDAANDQKAAPLKDLEQLPCRAAPACELKELCAQAYRVHLQSLQHVERVREVMRAGAGPRDNAVRLLETSEDELRRAREMMQACVTLQGRLTREYL